MCAESERRSVSIATMLPWGQHKERSPQLPSLSIDMDIRPGEFVMRTLFADFTLQAEKKIETVLAESVSDVWILLYANINAFIFWLGSVLYSNSQDTLICLNYQLKNCFVPDNFFYFLENLELSLAAPKKLRINLVLNLESTARIARSLHDYIRFCY